MESPIYHLENALPSEEGSDFTGPLDLILALLKKNKMVIRDIKISLILDQYLAWVERRQELRLDVASEFIAMASQLIYIKARMLIREERQEAESEIDELIRNLELHSREKSLQFIDGVIPIMERCYSSGCDYITGRGEDKYFLSEKRYTGESDELLRCLLSLCRRSKRDTETQAGITYMPESDFEYPLEEKEEEILNYISSYGSTSLAHFFTGTESRSEFVATLLAVLELCNDGKLLLHGRTLQGNLSPLSA